MDEGLLNKDLFKNYSKYCYPILFFVIVLLIVLLVSFNNLAGNVITSTANGDLAKISEIKYNFIGVQLLNFTTFILGCVLPIIIALVMCNYDKNSKTNNINDNMFSNKIISGALFIILPFLANTIMYMILIWAGFFGDLQTAVIEKLVSATVLGFAMSMLTFLLITIINISIKNPVVDSLLTLAIVLFVTQTFRFTSIPTVFLVFIIVFVWLALLYLGNTIYKRDKK